MKPKSNYKMNFWRYSGFFCVVFFIVTFSCKSPDRVKEHVTITCIEKYRELRSEKLNQPRRLIHNNDGGDTIFPIKSNDTTESDNDFSISAFLDIRSAGLVGTDVSAISYCSSRAFSLFIHNTEIGEVRKWDLNLPGRRNMIPEFLELGTDPLEVTANFAHENGFEIFWSHRVNDTHDAGHRIDRPHAQWSSFKEEHPEYLMGTITERVPSRWSSVDFKHQEIRDLFVEYFTEVCENYDVDGVELDFFRHLFLFGNVARHQGIATDEQLDMITGMLLRIREMTEKVGMEKGKPILILVRVPDSYDYAEGVGIALKEWVERGLIDIVVGGGYFRLNPWENMVYALRNYNVKYYADFSESRIRNEHPLLVRQQNAVFRARAAAAWQAGVDGIYSFNEYNSRAGYLSEIGQADKLTGTNNLYFVTYRGGSGLSDPEFYLKNGIQHFNLPTLFPQKPVNIESKPVEFTLEIGSENESSDVFVILYTEGVAPGDIKIAVNNEEGVYRNSTEDGLIIFEIPQRAIIAGNNNLMVSSVDQGSIHSGSKLLDAAILFCRNKDDTELEHLTALCF